MLLKRISKSSVMLRGAVISDVAKDRGIFISIVKPRTLPIICTLVRGVVYTGC